MFDENEDSYLEEYCQQDYTKDNPSENLDIAVHKIISMIGRSTYESKIHIEFDEYYSSKSILEELQNLVHKPWFREAILILTILLLKTGLWVVFRLAQKEGLEIANL